MKPICVQCQRFYRVKKNGEPFIEAMTTGDGAWAPYKLWMGDLWECPSCGSQIISGVGFNPIAEHYQDEFSAKAKGLGAKLVVNDC